MLFRKKEKKIYLIKYMNRYGSEASQIVLAFTKQKAAICLCQQLEIMDILSIKEIKYE